MLSLFNHVPDRQPPRIPAGLNNIQTIVKENTKKTIEYWNKMNWAVKSEHLLNVILSRMTSFYTDPLDVYGDILNKMGQYANPPQLVTALHYGRLQPDSHFYGKGNREIIISQPFDDSVSNILTTDWKRWEPVRIVAHPFTSIDYQLPDGKDRFTDERGLCVIKVDLALLYVQYLSWLKDDAESGYMITEEEQIKIPKTTMNFIHSFVLPNMLPSHIEQAWHNRLFMLSRGMSVNNHRGDRRLALPDSYIYMNQVHYKLIDDILKSRGNWHEWLCQIPGLFKKNLKAHVLQDDGVQETHQNKLAWGLGRIQALSWLVFMEAKVRTKSNGMYINEFIKQCREYENARTYGSIRGLDYRESEALFKQIKDLVMTL